MLSAGSLLGVYELFYEHKSSLLWIPVVKNYVRYVEMSCVTGTLSFEFT